MHPIDRSAGAGMALQPSRLARLLLLGMLALPVLAQSARAQESKGGGREYVLDGSHTKINFSIGHFFVSATQGQFTSFDGNLNFDPQAPEQGTVIIHVSPGSISTDNAARDAHLRTSDFFDVDKFPQVTFQSRNLVKNSGNTGTLSGTLSLHGVTRPIKLNVTLHTPDLDANRLDFSVTGTLKRSDYGMTNYLGVIGDEVTFDIQAEFDRRH